MSKLSAGSTSELANKIAGLVEERGWNQEDFARISKLNRHTVSQILQGGPKRRLRNATVSQCAEALGLTVNELRNLPMERLLPRMHGKPASDDEAVKVLYENATLPGLVGWLEKNKDRAATFQPDEIKELLDMQAVGGPLDKQGVDHCVDLIERRRMLVSRVRDIAATEYMGLIEQFVQVLHDRVKPVRK